jgi:hypothetical protein
VREKEAIALIDEQDRKLLQRLLQTEDVDAQMVSIQRDSTVEQTSTAYFVSQHRSWEEITREQSASGKLVRSRAADQRASDPLETSSGGSASARIGGGSLRAGKSALVSLYIIINWVICSAVEDGHYEAN